MTFAIVRDNFSPFGFQRVNTCRHQKKQFDIDVAQSRFAVKSSCEREMFERVLLFVHLFVGLRLLSMLVMWRPRVPRSFVRKANWTRRPLTEKMTIYALNDSRHLLALTNNLRNDLKAKGRTAWHEQICDRLIREHAAPKETDPNQAWRLKGSSKLNRREQAILRATWYWREREAINANKPPYFIVRHEDLVFLAETVISKKRKTAWPAKLSNRRFKSLRDAVGQALDLPQSEHPETPRTVRRRITQSEKLFYESLKVLRDKQAKTLNIDPTLIASRSTLVRLSLEDNDEHNRILPWQQELLNL